MPDKVEIMTTYVFACEPNACPVGNVRKLFAVNFK